MRLPTDQTPNVILTDHCRDRMLEQGISDDEVRECVRSGRRRTSAGGRIYSTLWPIVCGLKPGSEDEIVTTCWKEMP